MPFVRLLARLLVLAVLTLPAVGHAEDLAAAKQHFERGATLYDLQRYVEAAHEYELAYEAKPDPVFLYDIGQAYRLGAEPKKALGAYRAFRRHAPSDATRLGVDARIAELERQIANPSMAPPPKPAAEPKPAEPTLSPPPRPTVAPTVVAPPPPRPAEPRLAEPQGAPGAGRTKTIAGAVTLGVGAALLASGIALTIVGQNANDEIQNAPQGYLFNPATQDALKIDYPAGLALIGVGGAALIVGAAVLAVGVRERHRNVAFVPALAPRSAGAVMRLSF